MSILFLGLLSCTGPTLSDEVAKAYENLSDDIDFNYDVRPILSDRCYSCHGPDEEARQADLRLDIEDEARASLVSGNGKAIGGSVNRSELVTRILSADPEIMMPTPASHLTLSAKEKAILYKWIKDGAPYEEHWAFTRPLKADIPITDENWTAHNEIDHFIQEKLKGTNLEPSQESDKERLLRRLYMDLTGLPPAVEDIDRFLTDNDPRAYEKVVDELLTSPASAERLAMEWLDVSRYADSHGMHADGYRLMWPWRDWVIDAWQKNMPYDQFATWQIAGDLLPEASIDQKLATAFCRNHTMTAEGGAIDEEFRLAYVFDRTETVMTAFQGLTLNCARCHDHKFDPISQKEYYQVNAFFNNVKELGMTGDDGNYGPMLGLPDVRSQQELAAINQSIFNIQESIQLSKKEAAEKADFIQDLSSIKTRPIVHAALDKRRPAYLREFPESKDQVPSLKVYDGNKNIYGNKENEFVEGKKGQAITFTGVYDELYLKGVPSFEKSDPFSASLWMKTTKKEKDKTQMLLCTSGEKNNYWRGWEFDLDDNNHLNLRLIHSLPHNYLHVRSEDPVELDQWTQVGFTYDGSENAEGVILFINGRQTPSSIDYNRLYKSIHPVTFKSNDEYDDKTSREAFANPEIAYKLDNRPVRVGRSHRLYTGEEGGFNGALDEIKVFDKALSKAEMLVASDIEISTSDKEMKDLAMDHAIVSNTSVNIHQKTLKIHLTEKQQLIASIPEVMVMEELDTVRPMYIYNRGDYTQPTEMVSSAVPAVLPAFGEDLPQNRLGLARWLFDDDNPLTARVTVNRYWQMIFGNGIVDTPGDFGIQGALPTHPKLLDWLAVDLMEHGWDIKRLLKQIVMSHTYRQSSKIRPGDLEIDAENKLLARGASYRLPAEMIRDNALAASGLLVKESGGASVKPYQPDGLWIEKSFFSKILLTYKQDRGDDLFRRSMYTFVRRTSPPPAMTIFDQPNREVCTIKRENTNTPLQALVLMNDPQFVEAARVLAERIQIEGGEGFQSQISYAFRLTTGRSPNQEEISILRDLYEDQFSIYESDLASSKALLNVGETVTNKNSSIPHTAALAIVTSAILNHDEAYMKR